MMSITTHVDDQQVERYSAQTGLNPDDVRRILALRQEAGEAGDLEQVAICQTALRTPSMLRIEIEACLTAARREGYRGSDREYDLTVQDCEEIVAAVGPPTRAEWADAGYPSVGSAHVGGWTPEDARADCARVIADAAARR